VSYSSSLSKRTTSERGNVSAQAIQFLAKVSRMTGDLGELSAFQINIELSIRVPKRNPAIGPPRAIRVSDSATIRTRERCISNLESIYERRSHPMPMPLHLHPPYFAFDPASIALLRIVRKYFVNLEIFAYWERLAFDHDSDSRPVESIPSEWSDTL